MQLRFGFEGSTGAHACVRPSVCQVRRIVSEYDDSVGSVAAFYDTDQDEAEEEAAADALVEAEEEHLEITLDLYDAYARAVSSALINAPVLNNVEFAGFEHVLLVPSHNVNPDDLVYWSERDRFFLRGLDDLVIPALSEALATM
jgi:hypothetical protein